uniref:DUF632 domain-containing protein n=1 Tax=Arundo donax TaxID=35708 RepID=A0A0A9D8T0_ARUDO
MASHSHHAAAAAAASVSALPGPSTASVLDPSPPPPPPFPDFSHSSLQRSSSTPNIPMPDPRGAAKSHPTAGAAIREEGEEEEEDDGHIKTDSDDDEDDSDDDDDDDDEDDDHHEHDDVSVDGMVHGQPQKRIVMDSVGSSPVTPPPPPRLNPAPPTPATTPPPPVPESQMATWDYFFGPTPTPLPTLEQSADETWMDRREKEAVAEVKQPVTKPVVIELSAAEERPPQAAAEKEKAIEEMVANLPPSKPIIRKPPKAPGLSPAVHYQHALSMGAVETQKGKMMAASGTASLLHIVTQLDDHFLKASESAHDVSKILEATRMHYHSNHADSRGKCGHSVCFLIFSYSMLHTH